MVIGKDDTYYERNRSIYNKNTTEGCDIEVNWMGGSTLWLSMRTLKKDNLINTEKYEVYNYHLLGTGVWLVGQGYSEVVQEAN